MAQWTERNWKIIIWFMASVIVFFSGMYVRDFTLSAKIQDNHAAVIANETDIKHIKETYEENIARINESIKGIDKTLGTVTTDIAGIKAYIQAGK